MAYSVLVWDQIDHDRVEKQLAELVSTIRKEIESDRAIAQFKADSFISAQLREILEQRAHDWVRRAYGVYCDTWDRPKSPDFVRSVWFYGISPFIKKSVLELLKSGFSISSEELKWLSMKQHPVPASALAHAKLGTAQRITTQIEAHWHQTLELEALRTPSEAPVETGRFTKLLRLPESYKLNQDPIEGNPFPTDDQRHEVWEKATNQAHEQVCRLNAEHNALARTTPEDFAAGVIALITRKYDIWAARYIHVLWSDAQLPNYEQWLFTFAENWLALVAETYRPPIPFETFLNILRTTLISRMEWWKAEARRYLAEQKEHLAKAAEQKTPSKDSSADEKQALIEENHEPTTPGSMLGASERRAAVEAYIAEVLERTGEKITKTDIWKKAGYQSRTEFERWERNDTKNPNNAADKAFMRILTEKPHLK